MALVLALRALGADARMVIAPRCRRPICSRSRRRRHHGRRRGHRAFDAAVIMECSSLARTGVAGLDRSPVINIDHHPGNTRLRRGQLGRRIGGGVRRAGVHAARRARLAAHRRGRHPPLSRDPHRHRVVPLLAPVAAHLRHRRALRRGRRRSRVDRPHPLRQQQPGPGAPVRRGAVGDDGRLHRAASRCWRSPRRSPPPPAAPTTTPRASSTSRCR